MRKARLLVAVLAIPLVPGTTLRGSRAHAEVDVAPATIAADSADGSSASPTQAAPAVSPKPLPEAPFGLTWLQSRDEVAALGVELGPVFVSDFGDSFTAPRLPKEFADMHYSVLSFGYDDCLVRVVAVSEGYDHDRTAARVTARYQELADILAERYERVKSERLIDDQYDADRTALGFHNKRNSMYTELRAPDLRIELSVFAVANSTHWRLIFEYLPALRSLEQRRKRLDEDAL